MNYFVEIIKCQAVHSGISRYNTTTINIYSGFVCNTSQLSMSANLMADMMRRLKAPEPTMRLGPRSSWRKLLKTMPTMLRRISGAERGPSDIRTMLATAPFQISTSSSTCAAYLHIYVHLYCIIYILHMLIATTLIITNYSPSTFMLDMYH